MYKRIPESRSEALLAFPNGITRSLVPSLSPTRASAKGRRHVLFTAGHVGAAWCTRLNCFRILAADASLWAGSGGFLLGEFGGPGPAPLFPPGRIPPEPAVSSYGSSASVLLRPGRGESRCFLPLFQLVRFRQLLQVLDAKILAIAPPRMAARRLIVFLHHPREIFLLNPGRHVY